MGSAELIYYTGTGSSGTCEYTTDQFVALIMDILLLFCVTDRDVLCPVLNPEEYTDEELDILILWTGAKRV